MLAQNFKTASALRITDAEFDALVRVLGALERGELIHVPDRHETLPFPKGQSSFNMNLWNAPSNEDCGTVHCIGGWAEQFGGITWGLPRPIALTALFYPPLKAKVGYDDITTAQAAIALRNYLTHGEPRWEEALSAS